MSPRSDSTTGVVESLNVGTPRRVPANGHSILTAIWKHPVEGPVALRGVNLRGLREWMRDRVAADIA